MQPSFNRKYGGHMLEKIWNKKSILHPTSTWRGKCTYIYVHTYYIRMWTLIFSLFVRRWRGATTMETLPRGSLEMIIIAFLVQMGEGCRFWRGVNYFGFELRNLELASIQYRNWTISNTLNVKILLTFYIFHE